TWVALAGVADIAESRSGIYRIPPYGYLCGIVRKDGTSRHVPVIVRAGVIDGIGRYLSCTDHSGTGNGRALGRHHHYRSLKCSLTAAGIGDGQRNDIIAGCLVLVA